MVHVLRLEDLKAVEQSLRKLHEAYSANPILLSQTSLAWDDFRRAFGTGKSPRTPKNVSIAGDDMADNLGLEVLLEKSDVLPEAVRKSLLKMLRLFRRGEARSSRRIFRDSISGKRPSKTELELHMQECRTREWDERPIEELASKIESALLVLEPLTKSKPKPGAPKSQKTTQAKSIAVRERRKSPKTSWESIRLIVKAEVGLSLSPSSLQRYERKSRNG